MTPSPDSAVVRANFGNLHDAALTIASAFASLDVAAWLIGRERDRERVLYANFQIWVQHAIEHGEVWITDDKSAVAVWFPYEHVTAPAPAHYGQRLPLATGDYVTRFRLLDQSMEAHHPTQVPHHHLAFLAVRPDAQGMGLGSTLLAHQHARLDREQVPGYLEASSQRSRDLYLRHGYVDSGQPFHLPDGGPPMWPMWREPQHPTANDAANTAQTDYPVTQPGWDRDPTSAGYAAHPRGVVLSGRPGTSFAAILANRRLVETVMRRMLDRQVAEAEA